MVFSSKVLESESESKEEDKDALFDIKVSTITEGLLPCYARRLSQLPHDNALNIINFIMSLNTELNPSQNYRRDHINVLCYLSKFYNNEKKFENMTREDVLDFLDSFRKPEASDPLHKWIGTYNLFRSLIIKFFKWLHSPNIESKKRLTPSVVENIPQLKRKEQAINLQTY
jgi:hypothetical protein